MTDPHPWSDEMGDATGFERELVRAGRAVRPSPAQKLLIWGAIAEQCVPLAMGQGAALAGGKAAASTVLTVLKGAAVALLLGGGVVTSRWLTFRPAPTPAAMSAPVPLSVAPTAVEESSPEPRAGRDPAAEGPTVVRSAHRSAHPSAGARTDVPNDLASRVRVSGLREESAAILEARGALRAGDPARALTLLERAGLRFPDGILLQEREALIIEALAGSGQRALSSQRARSFLRNYPKSPHAADVASFLDGS